MRVSTKLKEDRYCPAKYKIQLTASADTSPKSRYIPAPVRRAVRDRDGNRCSFVDGERLSSRSGSASAPSVTNRILSSSHDFLSFLQNDLHVVETPALITDALEMPSLEHQSQALRAVREAASDAVDPVGGGLMGSLIGEGGFQKSRTATHRQTPVIGPERGAVAVPGREDVKIEGHHDGGVCWQSVEHQSYGVVAELSQKPPAAA